MSQFSKYARLLGRIKTAKKADASRRNGRLGGRPSPKIKKSLAANSEEDKRILRHEKV